MNSKSVKKIIGVLILSVLLSIIIAENNELKGKDFVRLGKLQTISGQLFEKDAEWYLKTSSETVALHFGPREFLKSKNVIFSAIDDFSITGFYYQSNLAVVNFTFNKQIIELRSKEGEPLWRGTRFSKKGKNENKKKTYVVDAKKCIGCRLCVNICPTNAISMINGKAVIDTEKCINCGICEDGNGKNYRGCPVDAISKEK